MATQIFVNLPVKDLKRSVAFFARLGFSFDPAFTDEKAAGVIVAKDIRVLLVAEGFFKALTGKELCDTGRSAEVLVCLALGSRVKVDELAAAALAAGGTTPTEAKDLGFMYQHGFQDLDGHIWELIYLAPVSPG